MTDPTPPARRRLTITGRLNALRAGVLGANDGIVSVAAVTVGVAGATTDMFAIVAAGVAAIVGGAISMALGEYVSVSSQRDSERAEIDREKKELTADPEGELAELAANYEARGLTPDTARKVAEELTAKDALAAHLALELRIDADDIVNPWQAAITSALTFLAGAMVPFLAILTPEDIRIPLSFAVVLVALAVTGAAGARLGGSPMLRPTMRVVVGGALALGATFLLGTLLGTTGIA
ncbi:VIT1/CCC1 transporter family protein [Pseudolysinimonas sp.]